MKVLLISHKSPFPIIDGGCLASSRLIDDLSHAKIDFDFLTYNSQNHPASKKIIKKNLPSNSKLFLFNINTKVSIWKLIKNISKNKNYQISRFKNNRSLKFIEKNHQYYDYIIMDNLWASINIPKNVSNIIYRAHNIEWKTHQNTTGIKGLIFKIQNKTLKTYEDKFIKSVYQVWSISKEDKKYHQELNKNTELIGTSIKSKLNKPKNKNIFKNVYHLGGLDWEPNKQAVRWLTSKIWPLVNTNYFNLNIAGKNTEKLKPGNYNIYGKINSLSDFLNNQDILIVPLKSGSGIRMKIIEALNYKILVIATKKAVQGFDMINGIHYLEANTTREFQEKFNFIINNNKSVIEISENGYEFINQKFSQIGITKKIKSLL